jgi:pyruvate/2-oxoacid:ferredoxin oxidoreductase beta subunit
MDERYSVAAARLAVETRVFPLFEVVDGVEWRITHAPQPRPVSEYLGLQGRFAKLDAAATERIQREVDDEYALLARHCAEGSTDWPLSPM